MDQEWQEKGSGKIGNNGAPREISTSSKNQTFDITQIATDEGSHKDNYKGLEFLNDFLPPSKKPHLHMQMWFHTT